MISSTGNRLKVKLRVRPKTTANMGVLESLANLNMWGFQEMVDTCY